MGSGGACAELSVQPGLYTSWRVMCPLLPQNNALVLRRAPERADPDQPTALSLASVGGCNLDACACFVGSTWRGDQGVKCMVLNISHVGKRLRMSNPGTHLGCEVPLER